MYARLMTRFFCLLCGTIRYSLCLTLHIATMLHLIGTVLPCCLGFRLPIYYIKPLAGGSTAIYLRYIYSGYRYNLLNVTVTKDGYHYQPLLSNVYRRSIYETYVNIYLGNVVPNDTGVYGCHLALSRLSSNATLLWKSTVSFYVPVQVQVRGTYTSK